MATFAVETIKITAIEPIPGADAIELAVIGPADVGYRSVIRKGAFSEGQVVAYIPEAALLPEWLIKDLGLEGKLAGSAKNRVKAVRLRGALSQGLVWIPPMGWDGWFRKYYPEIPARLDHMAEEPLLEDIHLDYAGIDITSHLGIQKWVPEINARMAGTVRTAPEWMCPTDSENIKRVGSELTLGELIYASEKVHGTQMSAGFDGECFYVSSKGVLGRGGILEESADNLYWQCFHHSHLDADLRKLYARFGVPVQLLGEAYGKVQDLQYGNPTGPLQFLAFDIRINNQFLDADDFWEVCQELNIVTVPLLYYGPYSVEKVKELTDGIETVSGRSLHLREGVVIKPARERNARWGRVSIKSVSADYLTRKGQTTEFE